MKQILHVFELLIYATLAVCTVGAIACTNEQELSDVLLISVLSIIAVFAIHFYRKEMKLTEVNSLTLCSLLFVMITFLATLKIKTFAYNYSQYQEKMQLLENFGNYYDATEELLDSAGITVDNPILESDVGAHYLNVKSIIDEYEK